MKGQWEVLERLLKEQRGVEEGGGGDKGGDEEKSLRAAEIAINWDGSRNLGDDNADDNKGEDTTNNMPVASNRRKPPP